MADRSAARRYARAFIELAQEAKKVDALGDELTLMKNACQQDDGLLMKVVCNPAFSKTERRDVLSAVMKARQTQRPGDTVPHNCARSDLAVVSGPV